MIEKTFEEIIYLTEHLDLMIVTATEIESTALLEKISPLPFFEGTIRVSKGNYTYHLGKFGSYTCIHFQCGMGSGNLTGSTMAVSESLRLFKAKAVVMPGIAFGIDPSKQEIGQVLVSELLMPYDFKRIGKESTIHRSPQPPANTILINRFKAGSMSDSNYKVSFGGLLTGDSLIDNIEERDELQRAFPTAIGGEMEGRGVYVAAETSKTPWILVKAICDFADGNKHVNKDDFQRKAAMNAVDFCHRVFSNEKSFEDLALTSIHNKNAVQWSPTDPNKTEFALFDRYTADCEAFYINRGIDQEFSSQLTKFSVWISGESGWGKTCLAMKHLTQGYNNKKIIYLGNYVRKSGEEIFYALLREIIDDASHKGGAELTKAAQQHLIKLSTTAPLCIYVDEIPLDSSATKEATDFVQNVTAFINYCSTGVPQNRIKFIFSSIFSPSNLVDATQKKVFERMTLLQIAEWQPKDLNNLIQTVLPHLGISISQEEQVYLIAESNGSPRAIKIALKAFLAYEGKKTLKDIIDQTKVAYAK